MSWKWLGTFWNICNMSNMTCGDVWGPCKNNSLGTSYIHWSSLGFINSDCWRIILPSDKVWNIFFQEMTTVELVPRHFHWKHINRGQFEEEEGLQQAQPVSIIIEKCFKTDFKEILTIFATAIHSFIHYFCWSQSQLPLGERWVHPLHMASD